MSHDSPQAAEDAFYDALETGDLDALLALWDDGDDIACSLPMRPLVTGREAVAGAWREALEALRRIDLQVKHIQWIESADLALHLVEESPVGAPGRPVAPVYAMNAYRRGENGWRLVVHQNAPVPPPPGFRPEGFPHLP